MRFSRAFLLTLFTREAALACTLLNAVVLTRTLGAAAMGTYSLVVTTANLVALVGSLGMNYANNFLAARHPEKAGQLFTHSFLPALVLVPAALMSDQVFPGAADGLFGNLSSTLRRLSWAGAVLMLINLNLSYVLYGLQRLKRHSVVTALTAAGTGVTNALAVPCLALQVEWAVGIWVIWNGLTLIVTCVLLRSVIRPVWGIDRPLLTESLRVGFRALSSAVPGYVSVRGVVILIDRLLGVAWVGYYSVAMPLAELVQHAPAALGSLVFTKASAREQSAGNVARIIRLHWIFSAMMGVALALTAPWIITVLFRKNFGPSVLPFQILIASSYFAGIWTVASSYVSGRLGLPWSLIGVTVVATALNLLLCLTFIPRWGLPGAAVASTVSSLVAAVVTLGYLVRVSEGALRLADFVPGFGDVRAAWHDLKAKSGPATTQA
jgi:O-antigen/teichoic acid export membrane protein